MDEEDDDQRLLHSLGVTSANIEDIEKKILSQVQTEPKHDDEPGAGVDDPSRSNVAPESDAQAKLHQKLRSVQLEIDAVASTIKRAKNTAGKKVDSSDSGDGHDKKKQKQADRTAQDEPHGGALQQALATERLKSLKKAKAQIQKEILQSDPYPSSSGSGNRKDKMLAMLVEDEPRRNKKSLMPARGPKKMSTPRLKTMSYNDDEDFDAVLDGASAGFMETEREELIRKGLLTPFHKLKGFEKRVELPEPSHRQNDPSEQAEEAIEASRIARIAQSMQQIAQSRPATKLLDPESLPRLDAPTAPFQRLGRPLKRPVSPSSEQERKRPLPDKKWRKPNSRKESLLETDDEDVGDFVASVSEDDDQAAEGFDGLCPVILEGGLRIPGTIYE